MHSSKNAHKDRPYELLKALLENGLKICPKKYQLFYILQPAGIAQLVEQWTVM